MTKKVALFVDNGGEELELIAPLDIMRRANEKGEGAPNGEPP